MGSSFELQSLSESSRPECRSGERGMPIAAGIDEVGYGPKLGPLVVAAAAFRVDDPTVNLWNALSSAVSDRRITERLPVLDSKELYSTASGVGTLEPTALAFLGLLPDRHTTSFRRL